MEESPGTTFVPLRPLRLRNARAVGGPVSRALLASYFAVALVGWLSATVVAIAAAGDLAAGRPLAGAPVLAVHLIALGTLPFAVSGASFHLLPVMLRNDLPSQRALWVALPLLGGGFLVAAGVEPHLEPAVWVGAAMLTLGLAIVLTELLMLVARAPRGRMLIASRAGVALACGHVVVALSLGAVIFSYDRPFAGLTYGRWLLIHLHVALLGWIALLILTVGRNLAPMLAQAPAAPARAGIALRERPLAVAGGAVVVLVLGRFVLLMLRVARRRKGAFEAPLAHLLAGGFFLVQAAATGLAAAAGAGDTRFVSGYVILLLVGWAGGVVVGHVVKLLSLSLWVWWPPGPRPKQAALHPRRLGLLEAAAFVAGVESLALGVFLGSASLARTGAVVLCASALLTVAGAALTWRLRARS
jgi:hypothetical protein